MFDKAFIEQAAFMYLRAMSFASIIAILRSWLEEDVCTKVRLIGHIELLADSLPSHEEITKRLHPKRSGLYALDGTWMKHAGEDFVLLVLLDVKTLDVVAYHVADTEDAESYGKLLDEALKDDSLQKEGFPKGFFCDGDPGLLKVLKERFPSVPIQLCVFHKYARAGQVIPFRYTKDPMDKIIKKRVEQVLFASTKEEALLHMEELQRYAREHEEYEKLKRIVGILKRNFDLLLTHYDNPEMSPYNNTLEGFSYLIKRKTRLMKGFKKKQNIHRWLKLILLDWRFHPLTSSEFSFRKNKSPLELAECSLPKIYNWMTYLRTHFSREKTT